jgi:hypothetical protein
MQIKLHFYMKINLKSYKRLDIFELSHKFLNSVCLKQLIIMKILLFVLIFFVIGIWCSQIPSSQNETSILLRTLRQSDQVGLNSLKLSQIGAAARAAYVLCKLFYVILWLHNYFNQITVL